MSDHMVMDTMAFVRRGDVVVVVHGNANPEDWEWSRYLEALSQATSPEDLGVLVLTVGGAPSASQRKRLQQTLKQIGASEMRSAVMMDALLPRMALRALAFLNHGMRGFAMDDVLGAMRYLGDPQGSWVDAELDVLCDALGMARPGTGAMGHRNNDRA